MPTYQITAPNGQTYSIEGPEGATDEQVRAAVLEQFPEASGPPSPSLSMKEFQQEILKRARAGQSPQEIRAFAETVRNPEDETGTVRYTIGPELEAVAEQFRGGYQGPVNVVDVTESSPVGAAVRGAADVLTFNTADELQAALQSAFTPEQYEDIVSRLRAQRAIDVQANPSERLLGQALGTVGSAAIPMNWALRGASAAGNVGRGAAVGAGMSALSGYGAAQSNEEAMTRLPGDVVTGAALGSFIPAGIAAVGRVAQVISPQSAMSSVLRESGIDANDIRRRVVDFVEKQGREPSLAEVLTEAEASVFSQNLSGSREARKRIVEESNRLQSQMGADIRSRVLREPPTRPPGTDIVPSPAGAATRAADGQPLISEIGRDVALRPSAVGPYGYVMPGRGTAGAADEAARPFDRIELPQVDISRVETPGSLEMKAKRFGDIAWGQFRNTPFDIGNDAGFIESIVLPNLSLPRAAKERIAINFQNNTLTVGDMDDIRRAFGKRANAGGPGSQDYADLRDDVLAMMSERVPETREAVARYAIYRQAAEGAKIGIQAASPETNLIKFVDDVSALSDRARRGVAPGARASIISQATGNPLQSYKFARELEINPGFTKRLETAIGKNEAQDIIQFSSQLRRGVDSLAAMSKIPVEKVENSLRRADGLIDIVAASTLGAGGAFKANIASQLFSRFGMSARVADRLADQLLDPRNRRNALRIIADTPMRDSKSKIGRGVNDVIRNAFIRTAAEIGKDNTQTPEDTLTFGEF